MKKICSMFVLVVAMMLTTIIPAAAAGKVNDTLSAEEFYSALQAEYEKYGMRIHLEESAGTVYTQEALDYELAKVKELADSVEITTTVDTAASAARSTLLTYTASTRAQCDIGYVTVKVTGTVIANPAAKVVTGVGGITSGATTPSKNFVKLTDKGQQHSVFELDKRYVHAIWYGHALFRTKNSTGDTVNLEIYYRDAKAIQIV